MDEFHSYTVGGSVHINLTSSNPYSDEVEGVRLVDWISQLIYGVEVEDISCKYEVGSCASTLTAD